MRRVPDSLRFMPALTVTHEEIDQMTGILDEVLRGRGQNPPPPTQGGPFGKQFPQVQNVFDWVEQGKTPKGPGQGGEVRLTRFWA